MTIRRNSVAVRVGKILIGGGAPVAIQSMANTDTGDVEATVEQIISLALAGSELVRVTVNTEEAARAVPLIKDELVKRGIPAPLIGDFHFNGHILLARFPDCARSLDKYRINPGTVGSGNLRAENFARMIEAAIKNEKPVRIGVNWGSLDRNLFTKMMDENAKRVDGSGAKAPASDKEVLLEALVASAINSARAAEKLGLPAERIILSVKTSDVQSVITAYEMLAARTRYALHLGLTEAGAGMKGLISSSAALAVLLQKGIGDTIRVSLTPAPGEPRTHEVHACQLLLQSMGIRQFRPLVTSCPGCGRTGNDLFQRLTQEVDAYIMKRMPEWKRTHAGIENLKVAVMGCAVNGPGESAHADIALSLPGKSEEPVALVFARGKLLKTLRGENLGAQFLEIVEKFVGSYQLGRAAAAAKAACRLVA